MVPALSSRVSETVASLEKMRQKKVAFEEFVADK
jgi:hypothetical protein